MSGDMVIGALGMLIVFLGITALLALITLPLSRIDRPVKGHDINDSDCVHWKGDFAGVDLHAVCNTCAGIPA